MNNEQLALHLNNGEVTRIAPNSEVLNSQSVYRVFFLEEKHNDNMTTHIQRNFPYIVWQLKFYGQKVKEKAKQWRTDKKHNKSSIFSQISNILMRPFVYS